MREQVITIGESDKSLPFRISLAGITYKDPDYHIIRKNAEISVIEYILDGAGTVIRNGNTYHVGEGDVYLLLAGDDVEYFPDPDNPWGKMWFNIDGDLANNLARLYHVDNQCRFPDAGCLPYFQQTLDICKDTELSSDEKNRRCAVLFHEIISKLHLGREQDMIVSSEAAALKNYMDVRLGQPVHIQNMTKIIHRSQSQVIRIFKAAYGVTPYEYLMNSRIVAAKRMLDETGMLIREIAFRTGFSDEHYFSDLFKRKVGCSPAAYRKRKQ